MSVEEQVEKQFSAEASNSVSQAEEKLNKVIAEADKIPIDDFDKEWNEVKTTSEKLMNRVRQTLGTSLEYLDNFINSMGQKLLDGNLISDEDLALILMRIPVQMYFLSKDISKLELEVSVAETNNKTDYSYCLLDIPDEKDGKKITVGVKESTATINSQKSKLMYYVCKSAIVELKSKINACEALLDSAKSINFKRVEEMKLANKGIGSEVE